jgi:hypothetical protein
MDPVTPAPANHPLGCRGAAPRLAFPHQRRSERPASRRTLTATATDGRVDFMLALTSQNKPASDAARQGGEMMRPLGLALLLVGLAAPAARQRPWSSARRTSSAWWQR